VDFRSEFQKTLRGSLAQPSASAGNQNALSLEQIFLEHGVSSVEVHDDCKRLCRDGACPVSLDATGERGKRRGKPRLYGVCLIARWSSEKRTSDTESSREAAQECSPQPALSLSKGRKPWVDSGTRASPNGAKEKLRPRLRRDDPALTHTLQ